MASNASEGNLKEAEIGYENISGSYFLRKPAKCGMQPKVTGANQLKIWSPKLDLSALCKLFITSHFYFLTFFKIVFSVILLSLSRPCKRAAP